MGWVRDKINSKEVKGRCHVLSLNAFRRRTAKPFAEVTVLSGLYSCQVVAVLMHTKLRFFCILSYFANKSETPAYS